MSEQMTAVHEIYGAFGRGDIPAILAHLSSDVEWEHDWGGQPLSLYTPRRGHQDVIGFFEGLSRLEFLQFAPENFLEGGNQVAVVIRLHARVRATGREVKDLEMHLWTFGPYGKVSRFRHLADTRQFALALGE